MTTQRRPSPGGDSRANFSGNEQEGDYQRRQVREAESIMHLRQRARGESMTNRKRFHTRCHALKFADAAGNAREEVRVQLHCATTGRPTVCR